MVWAAQLTVSRNRATSRIARLGVGHDPEHHRVHVHRHGVVRQRALAENDVERIRMSTMATMESVRA